MNAAELCNVVVLYASAYGNTAALAQAISRGITKSGVGVQTLNLEQCRCNAACDNTPSLGSAGVNCTGVTSARCELAV